MRPPGASMSWMARSAAGVSSTWCSTRSETARSKGAPSGGAAWMSKGIAVTLAGPPAASFSRATASMPADGSARTMLPTSAASARPSRPGAGPDVDGSHGARPAARAPG